MNPIENHDESHYDVIVLGGGLAGLSLARQLLLETGKTVLLLERKEEIPGPRQKVGESLVQLGGYYFSKVLDLEEHLLDEHYMKYNLRFYWKSSGRGNDGFEDYSQSYIRNFSNVASYQLDRNKLEAELLRRNLEDPRFRLAAPVRDVQVDLAEEPAGGREDGAQGTPKGARSAFEHRPQRPLAGMQAAAQEPAGGREDGAQGTPQGARSAFEHRPQRQPAGSPAPHTVRYTAGDGSERTVTASWVVDATGRARLLARRRKLARRNRIRHGSFFWWVEGRVDPERLSDQTPRQRRLRPDRAATGHLPQWLSTMHFMGPGFWFWVIPLQGKTSLGIVFDPEYVPHSEVFSVEKATAWVCRQFPLFARDLPQRKVLDFSGLRDYSHDCGQTLSPDRWAMAGEAGRFTDPLYSPGSDLIAVYNTLIVDAVETGDPAELAAKCQLYETLMRAVYEAYVPSYADGYAALGDPEAFALKYSWELAVYFAAYVFPFVNDLFTDRRFLLGFLRFFSELGPLNRNLQLLLAAYARWKAAEGRPAVPAAPVYFDFTEIAPLARAETTFYRVGVGPEEAREVLREQLDNLREMARFAAAHVAAAVAGKPDLVRRRAFVEALDPADVAFDPEAFRRLAAACSGDDGLWPWTFETGVLERYGEAGPHPDGHTGPPLHADRPHVGASRCAGPAAAETDLTEVTR